MLPGEDILPSNQKQIIEQPKFTYSLLEKAFEKQIKTIEDQSKKQIDALKVLEPKQSKVNLIKTQQPNKFMMDYQKEEWMKYQK